MNTLGKFLYLFFGYIMGIVVAFIVSSILFVSLVAMLGAPGPLYDFVTSSDSLEYFILALGTTISGAAGVLAASLFTPKTSRHISALIFTAFGCMFYIWFWYTISYQITLHRGDSAPTLPLLPWLLLGGISIAIFYMIRRRAAAECH